ncbi:MAG TPA: rhomboid family intramembrane serine protease, partial [Ferruginibacter sp.]|nr:rhomboid family intramembrane serine protease [Ferruginibacter sp.]
MPKHEQVIAITGMDNDSALANSYQAMQQLNWEILYAGPGMVGGSTPRSWKTKGEQIICRVDGQQLTVSSEMIDGQLADITGKNKKNCALFANAFESLLGSSDEARLSETKEAIENLRQTTAQQIAAQEQEDAETDKAMNLTGSNLYVTYTIIAINVLVFILMAVDGAGIMEPNGYVHLKWGSNFAPLTLSGDWWRLITNMFIHFGIIHLAMNMYCLYTVGIYLEPMLGKIRYTVAYLCTGLLASIASLWWHTEPANSAGASGAVFGLYGVFLALLSSNLIPKKVRQALLMNIVIFVGYNLLYGLKGGIDNAAHIGGLVSGLGIGYIYLMAIRKEKEQPAIQWLSPAILLFSILLAGYYLQQNNTDGTGRNAVLNEIKASSFKDSERFNKKLNEFDEIHQRIDGAIGDTSLTYEQMAKAIDEIALPGFEQATRLMEGANKLDIAPASHAKADLLLKYIGYKKE